jgi:hypothetical protein
VSVVKAIDTAETKVVAKGARARMSYNLNPVITEERELSRERDLTLEDLRAEIKASLADDGVIDREEATVITEMVNDLFASNSSSLLIVTVLDESGPEAASREADHSALKRRVRARKPRR